jgi:N-acetylmuramoyl-L-alanine amidase
LIFFLALLPPISGCAKRPSTNRQPYPLKYTGEAPAPAFALNSVKDPMPTPMPSTSSSLPQNPPLLLPPVKKGPHRNQDMIIVDPGHGGSDFGTHSLGVPKYHEKNLNLSTAQMLKNYLQSFGYNVIMTRTDDTFISLEDRATLANKQNAKLFVSVHYNSAPSREAEGVEVFFYRTDTDKSRIAKSKALAQAVLEKVIKNTKAHSRGVKHGNYAVIRETKIPAILIEGGFLTNEDEMDKIKTVPYMKSVALGIAQGIKEYLAKENVMADRL